MVVVVVVVEGRRVGTGLARCQKAPTGHDGVAGCPFSSRNMDQARHRGQQGSLDGLLPGQRSSGHFTANSYITPGPGAPSPIAGARH